MTTLLLSHPDCATHDTGSGHPESVARIEAVTAALAAPAFAALRRETAPAASREDLARVHPKQQIDRVLGSIPSQGHRALDADTVVSPGSGHAALHAAGAVCRAVDAVFSGEVTNAFCAVRPPGHHAEPDRAMGFCLFNSIAVGALRAQQVHGAERVAVIDFDVHHGNGTQAVAETLASLFYGSTHQWPLYPGTGSEAETGLGNVVNATLPPGTAGSGFRLAMERRILPALEAFRPDLILVSAGFDAHRADPLANLGLEEADFVWATEALLDAASRHCGGRLASCLEGGYHLGALASSCGEHVATLMKSA